MSLIHIMTDLETLGTVPGCVGFSIGAVQFYPDEMYFGKEFYEVIDVDSCTDLFLREEEDTKAWWGKQSDEAKAALHIARSGSAMPIVEALENFNGFLRSCGRATDIRLYGNGADFDNPILRCMYDAAGVKPYLSGNASWAGRCYRTLKNLHELFGSDFAAPKADRSGTYHNALDDARTQAMHLMMTVRLIKQTIDNRRSD